MKKMLAAVLTTLFLTMGIVSAMAETQNRILVLYFSCTGSTEQAAQWIADEANADLYRLYPTIPYTEDDLKYYTDCRADREQADDNARPEIANMPEKLSQYDVIFLGYPIWHGSAPKIMYTFLENANVSGKTIIPFCTSAASGIGDSATNLHAFTDETVTWDAGRRFAKTDAEETVREWANTFEFPEPDEKGRKIHVTSGGVTKTATLTNNASADAFYELLQAGPLEISMHDYGSFEKVGSLGQTIVRSDEKITTVPGDIILYLGNQITVYYAENTYTFTLLGHIDGATGENMREFLGEDSPMVKFTIETQKTETIELPDGVTEIGSEAFRGTDADSYVIPYGIQRIESRSFADLKRAATIVIPDSVTDIADDAFSGSTVKFACGSGSAAETFANRHGIEVKGE